MIISNDSLHVNRAGLDRPPCIWQTISTTSITTPLRMLERPMNAGKLYRRGRGIVPRGPYQRQDPSDLNVRAVAPEIFNALIALAQADHTTIAAQAIRAL